MRVRPHSFSHRLAEMNWLVIGIMSLIALLGILMMISAGGGDFSPWAEQQLIRFMMAFGLMLLIATLPMRLLFDYAYLIYGLCLLVLVGVDVMGHTGMGAQRWLRFGGVNLQPSEFMKLALILALARHFHQMHTEDVRRISFLLVPGLLIVLPAIFILRQPNLGTTIILASVGGILCFMAGLQWRYIIGLGAGLLASLPVVWHFLHDYQKRRVLTFLDPTQDPLGAGYNIMQSMIAIGSGGFFGKGYLQGSQNQLNFLPEKHTDFIFTMLTEELGFLGGFLLLSLYGLLLVCGMVIADRSRSTFGAMMAVGVVALLFMHIFINCAMVMGMLPVVGVPLPLMSYGGSITVSTVLAMGLVLNAWVHRDQMPSRLRPKF